MHQIGIYSAGFPDPKMVGCSLGVSESEQELEAASRLSRPVTPFTINTHIRITSQGRSFVDNDRQQSRWHSRGDDSKTRSIIGFSVLCGWISPDIKLARSCPYFNDIPVRLSIHRSSYVLVSTVPQIHLGSGMATEKIFEVVPWHPGDEIPTRKKRQYGRTEAARVANNRGYACSLHRKRKMKLRLCLVGESDGSRKKLIV